MQPEGFDILYENGPCVVVSKPAGLLTQAPPEIDSMVVRLKSYFKERDNKPGRVYLGVPHRLDRPVSGAMVFARHVRAARRIAEQFQSRMVEKRYWAVLEGEAAESEGTLQDYVRKVPDVAQAEIAEREQVDARLAILHYKVLHRWPGRTWVEVQLETGRMHQIRLQFGSRGLPVLGDVQYGSGSHFGGQPADPRQRSIALHARSLRFQHPMTREPIYQEAPLPDSWREFELPEYMRADYR